MFFKILSFDIEVLPLNKQMPVPDKCPILLVSIYFNYDHLIENTKTRNIVYILTKDEERIEVQEKRVVIYTKSEVKIIKGLLELIKDCDVIVGYNINGFDIPYVIDRAKVLGIRSMYVGLGDKSLWYQKTLSKGFTVTKITGVTGRIIFDVLTLMKREDESNVFKKKFNLKSLTLEHVSKEILGIEKLEFSIDEMERYWNDTSNTELKNKFIDYCSRDSELALMFVTKFRLLDKFITLSRASGRLVQDVIGSMGSGVMVENLLLKEFRKFDRVMPMRVRSESYGNEDKKEELEGAEVFEPVLGVSENICSVDYKSLYPSLMIKHNLCYSTLVLDDMKKLGLRDEDVEVQLDEFGNPYARFVRKEVFKGIVPRKLEELLALRASQKKEMKKYDKSSTEYLMWDASQNATKILLNSHYGYSGDAEAKIYSWFVATAVTTNGRKQIKKTWKMITEDIGKVRISEREFKLGVTQGDTDSSYMQVIALDNNIVSRDEAIRTVNLVLEKVNATLEKPMQLDFENYVKRIVIVAKKHYAMLVIDDNGKQSIVSKGIETIRRDWCNFATDTMAKIVDFILKEDEIEVGVNKSVELVKEQADLLKKDKIDINSLVLSKRLKKYITLYDGKQPHVQVAIKMKQRGKPSEVGDRIEYIITDNGKELVNERAEEAEFVMKNLDKIKIDKDYYLYHQLIPPSMRILSLLGIKKDVLMMQMDKAQTSLTDWF